MLSVGSLFSGVGGFELGLETTGQFHTKWQVENDDYCKRTLAELWPKVERFDDVHDVGAFNLSPVDVICGGFPCQDVSNAGKRAGFRTDDDEATRSGLWFQF